MCWQANKRKNYVSAHGREAATEQARVLGLEAVARVQRVGLYAVDLYNNDNNNN